MKEERLKKGQLKRSSERFTELYPVLYSEDGELLDGRHRLEDNPRWKSVKLKGVKSKRDKLKVRILSNWTRRDKIPEMKEWLNQLAEDLCRDKKTKQQGVERVFKFLDGAVSSRTIYRYLRPEFKRKYKRIRHVAKLQRMYVDTKTWNPIVGCNHKCIYCVPSFQNFWKRRFKDCPDCQIFTPHQHDFRMPKNEIIFVLGNADPTFLTEEQRDYIIDELHKYPEKTYFLQSKDPKCFEEWLPIPEETLEETKERLEGIFRGKYPENFRREGRIGIPENTYLLTTLETNRDDGYEKISEAPKPSQRYKDFLSLKWDKKIVTIEPIMEFDLDTFVEWIVNIKPKAVFIGYNSHPQWIQQHYLDTYKLFEPDPEKVLDFIVALKNKGIRVLLKEMRKMAYKDY